MKIRIGLIAYAVGWEQVCNQEGIPFAVIDLATTTIADECSILVVNRTVNSRERELIEQYLRGGGAVLGFTGHLLHVAGIDGTWQELAYVVSEHESIFLSVHLLDVGVRGFVPRGANAMRTDSNTFAIAVGPLMGGFAVVLPFDVGDLVQDQRPANRSFHFTLDRLPSERVSHVSKGELHHLVHDAFTYLHNVRGIPHVHLWYFPNGAKNVFAFRIDSDGALQQDIDALYKLGRDNQISMSWFLDVKSHEQWLDHFRSFVDQEIGLHCYEHQTYPTFDANLKNIMKGLQAIRRVGLQPQSFTAPFGIWNEGLAKAIDEAGFEYTSEFSFAYDSLPLFTSADTVKFNTMQVPIHPVCIGSMLRIGYSGTQMSDYFSMIVKQKISRSEPLFFYHHPSHRHWEVVAELFQFVQSLGVESMTLGMYARWWKHRTGLEFTVDWAEGNILVERAGSPIASDVWLRVIHPEQGEVTVPITNNIDLESVTWRGREKRAAPPSDIRRIREFDPRRMIGEFYDGLIRKLR